MINSLRARLRDRIARRLQLPAIPFSLERLAALGYTPSVIFDVGAYRGEFARLSLRRWPRASVWCFDAITSTRDELRKLAASDPRIHVMNTLVGSRNQQAVKLYEAETASSVLVEHDEQRFPFQEKTMVTLDAITAQHGMRPSLIKIDVQGYELEVLRGAETTLQSADCILAELNLIDIHGGAPLADEVIAWLAARGWVMYDVAGLTRRPLDHALWQVDFVFLPANSSYRKDKRYQNRRNEN